MQANPRARPACINLQATLSLGSMNDPSTFPLYQLLAAKLGEDPVADMGRRRQAGASWRTIELVYLSEFDFSVTQATLRAWYAAATASA